MKRFKWIRFLALALLLAMAVGAIPAAMATEESAVEQTVQDSVSDDPLEVEPEATASVSPEPEPIPSQQPPGAEESQEEMEESTDDLEPTDMNGETLTRHAKNTGGRMRATRSGGYGIVSKSTCVDFAGYTSPYWYCNRYSTQGTHVYGHYYYAATIAYHTVDGEYSYCIEPNTSSINGATYYSYDGNSAASDSYWMLELDSWQRYYIQQIMAFGYPSIDRGYSVQAQYAATQTLIWEVVSKCRYNDGIMYSSDYGLFSKIYAVLGAPYQACYDGILASIASGISDGTVPGFAGSSYGGATTVNLTLNASTGCYEGSLWDGNGVLSHYNFSASGVTFSKSGNTLYISVPASSAGSIKGTVITGTSDQVLMSTSNPSIWENSTYQTVLSAGNVENAKAYIKLNWSDTGSLKLVKTVSDSSVSRKGWTFYFKNNATGQTVTKTTDSNGVISVTGLTAGTTYTVTEKAYEGYIQPAAQTVTIQAGKTTEIKFHNVRRQWQATVTKVDAETGTAQGNTSLDGAQYTLYKSGNAVKVYTVKNGGFTTDFYPCTDNNGVYTLKETKAPPGYKLDPTVYKLTTGYSHYSAAENNIKLTVSDQVIKGRIQLEKWAVNTVSGTKQPEKGATFNVWLKSAGSYAKAKAAERDVITIGADGKGTSKELPYGTYFVQQTHTWDGYDIDKTVYERTVDGTNSGNNDTLSLHNDIWIGTLSIFKVDGDTKEPLSGAEFTLTGTDDSKVVLVTDDQGTAVFDDLVYGVTYTWAETKAPKGYLLNEDNTGTWEVSKHDDSIEITCEDYRRPGSISITKQNTDGDLLPGAVFLLEYLDGDIWKPVTFRNDNVVTKGACTSEYLKEGQLTTDESDMVIFSGLWADDTLKYRLTEVKAPEGYELLKEPVFEGVLPVSYPEEKVTAEPEEILDGTAYFYTPIFTVTNGHVYEMPMTGGRNLPLKPLGIMLIMLGIVPIVLYFKNRRAFT